jgi:hypothetical protein
MPTKRIRGFAAAECLLDFDGVCFFGMLPLCGDAADRDKWRVHRETFIRVFNVGIDSKKGTDR